MLKPRLLSLLHSKAFTKTCYVTLVILGGAYAYQKYTTAGASSRELNISCFSYRDINRNGIYDLADRPYAGLKATLRGPSQDPVFVVSNISGFANFKMGYRHRNADVREPGEYTVTVSPPAGWKVTSGNAVQTLTLTRLEQSPAGIVAPRSFLPVGVAPDLVISGNAGARSSAPSAVLHAISPTGKSVEVPVTQNGDYSLPAEAGDWRLTLSTPGGPTRSRTIMVRDYAVTVSKLASGDLPAQPARRLSQKVDFDSLTPSDTLYEIPNGYAGFKWSNWVATHQKLYRSDGTINCAVSSEYVAYNSSGFPATISSETNFDLVGVFLGVAWPEADEYHAVIKAWRGDQLVYEDRIKPSTRGPVYFDADYREISRLEFSSEGSWQVVIDDLEVRRD